MAQVIWSADETESKTLREELHRKYPAAASYLANNIWTNSELFCAYSVQKHLTFNAQSTQRAESLHSLIKRDNKYGQRLAINTSAQQLFKLLHNMALHQDKANVERDRKELQQTKVYHIFSYHTLMLNIIELCANYCNMCYYLNAVGIRLRYCSYCVDGSNGAFDQVCQ